MNLAPDTTVTIPLDDAYKLAPALLSNIGWLLRSAQGVNGRTKPVACRLSGDEGEESELAGLLSPEEATSPGALVVLPDEADKCLDALLEKKFCAMGVPYDGNMKCMAVYALEDDQGEVAVAIEMSVLKGLGEGAFTLAVVCNDKLRIRRITNQPPDDDEGLAGMVQSYDPYNVYSQAELDEAARRERAGEHEYWLAQEVMREDKRRRLAELHAKKFDDMLNHVLRRKAARRAAGLPV